MANKDEEGRRASAPENAVPKPTAAKPAAPTEDAAQQGRTGQGAKIFAVGFRKPDLEFLDEAITGLLAEQNLTEEEALRVKAAFDRYKPTLFKDYRRSVLLPAEANLNEEQTSLVIQAVLDNGSNICRFYNTILTEAALSIVGLLAALEKPPR